MDQEVRRIVDGAERDVIQLLEEERERLEALAKALLERETLDQPEAYEWRASRCRRRRPRPRPPRSSADRLQQRRTRLFTAPALLRTDPAVLVVRGVALALLGAGGALLTTHR